MIYTQSGISHLQQKGLKVPEMTRLDDGIYIDWENKLGGGNFGTVYKGYSMIDQRPIAIKHLENYHKAGSQVEREMEVMSTLNKASHPHIMGYHGHLTISQSPNRGLYLLVEYCPGGTLKQLCSQRISELRVVSLFRQLLQAMVYINDKNIMHRDLKPDNILLDQNGNLKVADFGFARGVAANMTYNKGTPLYSAPEMVLFAEGNYTQNCDAWSAGLILYEMLAGREFLAEVKTFPQLKTAIEEFEHPQRIKIDFSVQVHPLWQKIIRSMLVFDRTKRPHFHNILQEYEQQSKDILQSIASRYDYEAGSLRSSDSSLLTQDIRRIKGQQQEEGIKERLEMENSYLLINMLRKYLKFRADKNELLTRLLRTFTRYKYQYLRNVHKYILMFLSTAAYVAGQKHILDQFDRKQFKVAPEKTVFVTDNVKGPHKKAFEVIVNDLKQVEAKNTKRFREALKTQIIPKILFTYSQRPPEWEVVTQVQGLVELLKQASDGNYAQPEQYQALYLQMLASRQVYTTEKQMSRFEVQDIRAYTDIRLVGHLDKVLDASQYHNEDCVDMLKQRLETMEREELVDFVRNLQSK